MTPFQQRFLTAILMAPLFLGLVYLGGIVFSALILIISLIGFYEWWRLPKILPVKLAGILYLGIPAISLIWLRQQSLGAILLLIMAVWATDIGAYFSGRHFGGPKLAPTISPNKTWSGLLGGVIASALVSGTLAMALHVANAEVYFAAGALLAVIAQGGDLFESHMKRRAGVKDSGRLIPGHGGILDRIDGFLTAAPCFALFMWIMA